MIENSGNGDVIDRLALDRVELSQTHGRGREISGYRRTLGTVIWAALNNRLGPEQLFYKHQSR